MSVEISGHTRLCCLFGDPVEHSLSPRLHNLGFQVMDLDYRYLAFRVEEQDIGRAIDAARLMNIRGFNLTMPDKIAVIPYLDKLDPAAETIGAVNTVINENGTLIGYNTDGYGAMMSFEKAGCTIAGKKLIQMGMGGAGTAVAAQAALDGAREISVFSPSTGKSWHRAGNEVVKIRERTGCNINLYDSNDLDLLRTEIATSDLFMNTTPIGMGKLEGKSPVPDPSYLHEGLVVQDAIYQPKETELMRMAARAGARSVNGLGMLFYQGARAFELFTGVKMPLEPEVLLGSGPTWMNPEKAAETARKESFVPAGARADEAPVADRPDDEE